MRFRFSTRCLVAAIVLSPVFLAFAVQTDDPKQDHHSPAKTAGSYYICPLSMIFYHGGYVTYYAKQCGDNECYRTWDDVPGLPLANGSNCCKDTNHTNCKGPLTLDKVRVSTGGRKNFADPPNPLKDKGYGKTNADRTPHNESLWPTYNKGVAKRLDHHYVKFNRKLQPAHDEVYAQLILIRYQYIDDDDKKYPPTIIGTGHEVEPPAGVEPDFTVLPEDVEVAGDRCHILSVGDVKFTVLLHNNSPPDKDP